MNRYSTWKSDGNGMPVLMIPIGPRHEFLIECCEMTGLCAIPEASQTLIDGIEMWLDRLAVYRAFRTS